MSVIAMQLSFYWCALCTLFAAYVKCERRYRRQWET